MVPQKKEGCSEDEESEEKETEQERAKRLKKEEDKKRKEEEKARKKEEKEAEKRKLKEERKQFNTKVQDARKAWLHARWYTNLAASKTKTLLGLFSYIGKHRIFHAGSTMTNTSLQNGSLPPFRFSCKQVATAVTGKIADVRAREARAATLLLSCKPCGFPKLAFYPPSHTHMFKRHLAAF